MQTKKIFGTEEYVEDSAFDPSEQSSGGVRKKQSLGMRILTAALDGGKSGVDIGLSIIPGVLVICTIVMMLTKVPPKAVCTRARLTKAFRCSPAQRMQSSSFCSLCSGFPPPMQ